MSTRLWPIVVVVAVVAAFAAFHFWSAAAPPITNYPSSGTDIVAFGDSLVAGYGSTPGHDFVSLLSQSIGRPIVNLGEDGDTTAAALARINELDKYNPQVVIVLVGGNDYLDHDDMTQAFVNLGHIIEDIEGRGAVVLLVGVRVSPVVGNFDSQFNALVAKYHVAYAPDIMDGIFGNPQLMTSDGIHPNDAGYVLIAKRILPVLQGVLR